jgi:very-short-patch-repair endonuclease
MNLTEVPATILGTAMGYAIPLLLTAIAMSYISSRIGRRKKPRRRMSFPALAIPDKGQEEFPVEARRPLTKWEERMFQTLITALPECIVLAQVSFSALITSERQHRNYYDRKYADFVICTPNLTPVAICELDDPTHLLKRDSDAARDALMARAGYTTIRFNRIPEPQEIRDEIERLLLVKTGTF